MGLEGLDLLGATYVSPYSDIYGGAVLNPTISIHAYSTIELRDDGKIDIVSFDTKKNIWIIRLI